MLDVGSGTGATALALNLLRPTHRMDVLGLEPSSEMTALAECVGLSGQVVAHYRQGSVADVLVNPQLLKPFDLIVFSACFPYGFDRWEDLGAALGDYQARDGRTILAIEPEAKSGALDSLARVLHNHGWPVAKSSSRNLPEFMTRGDVPLNRVVRVWRRAGSPGAYVPSSWWSPPADEFLVANRKPDWSSLQSLVPALLRT